ncbi:MAG: hypothetical protein ACQEP1_06120, partial [Nanobdellota archaeon]
LVFVAEELSGGFFAPVYSFILENAQLIQVGGFIFGTLALLFISLYLTGHLHVKRPSVIHVLHEEGRAVGARKKIERFFTIFFVLLAFFILAFNLMMEWLAIIVDASVIVLAFLYFVYVFFKKRNFNVDSFIHKLGENVEGFYAKFIELFHSRRRFMLGFSGMLVLHLLTDLALFVFPSLGLHENVYIGIDNISSVFSSVVSGLGVLEKVVVFLVFVLVYVALFFLMFGPAYIWWKVYKREGMRLYRWEISLFLGSVVVFLLAPFIDFSSIISGKMTGVAIGYSTIALNSYFGALALGIFVFFLVDVLLPRFKRLLTKLSFAIVLGFFTYYIYKYVLSIANTYAGSVKTLFSLGNIYISVFMGLFMVILLLSYLFGWIAFLRESFYEIRRTR